ncbi:MULTISPECIES: hypothetical protein [Streptomyces]|uniref:Uncharacterized protein n=2 Tax=Streptomyces avermitilis TaxID=33903 RepID=Q82DK6_STRAW|nr:MULTISPECIES: hypothetical protein [Streptomyces]BAC72682.1 hypothetical protein SAVERM_4970 [Streptomyces avermitilis MA-4680 = NBRC 14893]BBJ53056.1 hypothetical protein SAVMC3_56850 [Streptomyces avermitilis]GDY65075.1 hypothetical protein SAV14893_044680 [Streptomyces avermitilis]GDY74723.1 hypothetical protein SAV31267_042080 [Streptomyces avermitilis]GDY83760.1 hypothetical protein SAVCW2_29590 [Streptomyces avermitilis]
MPASERDEAPPRASAGVSMRDLLASCAAARAVSTPPRAPAPVSVSAVKPVELRRPEAA